MAAPKWCDWQIKAAEDTEDTWTCCAHLAEGRAFPCPCRLVDGRACVLSEGVCQCEDYKPAKEEPVTRPADYPPVPQHEKLRAVRDRSQVIGAFLEWLQAGRQPPVLLSIYDSGVRLHLLSLRTEQLLAEYFEIDLDALEAEKRAILDYQRALDARGGKLLP